MSPSGSSTPLPPVFIEALLHEGEQFPVTVMDPERWATDYVYVLTREGEAELTDEEGHDVIVVAATQDEIVSALGRYGTTGFYHLPCSLLNSLYTVDPAIDTITPDVDVIVGAETRRFGGLAVLDRITALRHAIQEYELANKDLMIDGADFGPTTLDAADIRHIEEVASSYDWIAAISVVSYDGSEGKFNGVLYVVDDPNQDRYEQIRAITNALQIDLGLSALGYGFDPRFGKVRRPAPKEPNTLKPLDECELDENGFGPHGLRDDQVDTLNEILAHHDWVLSARVVSQDHGDCEVNALILGAQGNQEINMRKMHNLAREVKELIPDFNLIGSGLDKEIGPTKVISYTTRGLEL